MIGINHILFFLAIVSPLAVLARAWWSGPTTGEQPNRFRHAPMVLAFILLNIAVFLFEIAHPHWQEPIALHRLGALEPYAVIVRHQYWRLFTALFLHYDVVHLLFNLF